VPSSGSTTQIEDVAVVEGGVAAEFFADDREAGRLEPCAHQVLRVDVGLHLHVVVGRKVDLHLRALGEQVAGGDGRLQGDGFQGFEGGRAHRGQGGSGRSVRQT
jgi:hypothetical protein